MTEKEFYKQVRIAINMAVNRFYKGLDFDGHQELKKKTKRSIYYEYKSKMSEDLKF